MDIPDRSGRREHPIAARAWRAKDYAFYCLIPWGMHTAAPWSLPSHSINPLSILDPASETFSSDSELLTDVIVTRTGGEAGSAAYFKEEARSGIRAFLMHIVTAEPEERRTLLTLRQYITATSEEWEALLAAMKSNIAGGGLIAREAEQHERRETQAAEEWSAILSTMKQDTNFIEDPVMQRALASSTARLSELKGFRKGRALPGCALSVVIPLQYLETHAAYARLIIGCALWTMQERPLSRGRVLFLIDEFPALKRMDRISTGLATLRKYKVWFWPVIQNLGQLKLLYGQNWQGFMSNSGCKQFIGASDLESAQYISELCGEGTIEVTSRSPGGKTVSETGRRLATAEEIMHIASDQQFLFIDNLRPFVLRKTTYWERPSFPNKFNRNPYQASTPDLDRRTFAWKIKGLGLRFCAWLAGPSPAVMAALFFWLLHSSGTGILIGESGSTKDRQGCAYLRTDGVKAFSWRRRGPDQSCAWITFI